MGTKPSANFRSHAVINPVGKNQRAILPGANDDAKFRRVFLGFAMGPRLGGLAVLAYLAEGAVGLPVFSGTPAKGIGLGYMLGTTGGYLIGFLCAVLVTGYLANRHWGRSYLLTALAAQQG